MKLKLTSARRARILLSIGAAAGLVCVVLGVRSTISVFGSMRDVLSHDGGLASVSAGLGAEFLAIVLGLVVFVACLFWLLRLAQRRPAGKA